MLETCNNLEIVQNFKLYKVDLSAKMGGSFEPLEPPLRTGLKLFYQLGLFGGNWCKSFDML